MHSSRIVTGGVTTIAERRGGRPDGSPRASLSIFCMTAGPGPRVAALLESLRPVADEILVALDDRAAADVRTDVVAVADRVVVYPYAEPVDRPLPWLFGQCRGEWALTIDDDEIPSLALIAALRELCRDQTVTHYSLPRRWLFPDTNTFLDDSPWRPDYQLRLLRTDPRIVRFSSEFHRPIVAAGPGRFLEEPLWHVDTLLRTREQRLEKARRYERTRPGMRIGGRALNFAFYVPELRVEPRLGPVPADEQAHVDAILGAGPPAGRPRATIEHATREQIDALWPSADPAEQAGRLELLEQPTSLAAAEQRTLDVRVHNTGTAVWPWGADGVPAIRIGSRVYDGSGAEVPDAELWSVLPAPLEPGASQVVPVHVRAPESPGTYRVEIDLVHEHVGRLGAAVGCRLQVRPLCRLAVTGDAAAVAELAQVVERVPELELVVLRRAPRQSSVGYPEAPDLRPYLFDDAPHGWARFAATLLWRSLRLRVGPPPQRAEPFFTALRGCEALVVAGLDGPPQRRERWAVATAARAARSLGVPVVTSRSPTELLSLLGR